MNEPEGGEILHCLNAESFIFLMETTYNIHNEWLTYVWINIRTRTLSLQSDDGNIEKVRFSWDEDGAKGFAEVVSVIKEIMPEDMRCFVL